MSAVVVPMRKPDDPQMRLRLHAEITAAQNALTDARGRLLEARTREQFEAVSKSLRRAARHVDNAASQCIAVVARSSGDPREGEDE